MLPYLKWFVANEIIPYLEMCQREGLSLQRGMNFDSGQGYSVILMSVRRNAPYRDRFEAGGTIIYEGHDVSKRSGNDPKHVDQPEHTPRGLLTPNGQFHRAATRFKNGESPASKVRVYEKIQDGVWSYNGLFNLCDSWREHDGRRWVFRFRFEATNEQTTIEATDPVPIRRVIPTHIKVEVYRRDRGKCVRCGDTKNLHFDHDFPFSLGGSSITADNVQLLCARHNLEKGAKIQ